MKYIKAIAFGVLCYLYLPATVWAGANEQSWAAWFNEQINQHPDVIAAKQKMNAFLSLADAREMPLYNPELETEYDREGQYNNYLIGINQTFDWWDKLDVRKQQASYSRELARQSFELTVQQKTAEALQALIEWQAAYQQAELARNQEEQLATLLDLVTVRQQAGDLGLVDAELAFLSLSQKLSITAKTLAQFKQIEANLRQLLPNWSPQSAQISEHLWLSKNVLAVSPELAVKWVDEYPTVLAAKAKWQYLQQSAELARLETKAEPTFGINAGRIETDDSNVVGLTFSIPLHVRNNFTHEARSVSQEALSAEAEYQSIRRKQQYAIESSQSTLQEYKQHYQRWQNLMQGRVERSKNLLEKQWHNGDLSTSVYLLALQQRTEGLTAGIELRKQFHLASINFLLQSGQIKTALTPLTK